MKEHPIIFKGEMIRALLNGTKTQTRRTNLKTKYAVGDRLWVRETFTRHEDESGFGSGTTLYRADMEGYEAPWNWSPSLFMPRHASRITLEVTALREERLQDISEEDAMAEGIEERFGVVGCNGNGGYHHEVMGYWYLFEGGDDRGYDEAALAYRALWESINGPGSWDENPVVKVISFKRVDESSVSR